MGTGRPRYRHPLRVDLAKYLESGRLRLVLPHYTLPSADLFVYYSNKRNQSTRAKAFIDFLVEKLDATLDAQLDVKLDARLDATVEASPPLNART